MARLNYETKHENSAVGGAGTSPQCRHPEKISVIILGRGGKYLTV
jgi:hypothetical protein